MYHPLKKCLKGRKIMNTMVNIWLMMIDINGLYMANIWCQLVVYGFYSHGGSPIAGWFISGKILLRYG